MKPLIYLLFFCSFVASAQTASNRPELAEEIIHSFADNAEMRGIEVSERLSRINKILFLPGAKNEHRHQGGVCTITINADITDDHERLFAVYHEIGHHFGLRHCLECSYNVMTEIKTGKVQYLFNDRPVRLLYLDLFFEAIRNPKKYNEGHTHY